MTRQMDPDKMWATMQTGSAKALGITPAEKEGWMALGEDKAKFATEVLRDVFKAGGTGATADYVLEAKPWTGRYVEALAGLDDVELWHGDEDATTPFAAALHLKGKVPKAALHKVEGFGHELGVFILEARLDDLAVAPLAMER